LFFVVYKLFKCQRAKKNKLALKLKSKYHFNTKKKISKEKSLMLQEKDYITHLPSLSIK